MRSPVGTGDFPEDFGGSIDAGASLAVVTCSQFEWWRAAGAAVAVAVAVESRLCRGICVIVALCISLSMHWKIHNVTDRLGRI